jgi:ParB-like chromosome segregation protein Spo0J
MNTKRKTQAGARGKKEQRTGPDPGTAAVQDPGAIKIVLLPVSRLRPSGWNANVMQPEEEAELAEEVRRLGRPPKPIVVRAKSKGHEIVDGEHSWKAARDCGLAQVPCEVIEADDFEAMRQSFKRNRHGKDDPVLLGRLFKQMMQTKGLSGRELGRLLHLSEGTVRNFVRYAEAAGVRNRYAPETGEATVRGLSVAQVRQYLDLPEARRDEWLDRGADGEEAARILAQVRTESAGTANRNEQRTQARTVPGNEANEAATADQAEGNAATAYAALDDGEDRAQTSPAPATRQDNGDAEPLSQAERELVNSVLVSYRGARNPVRQKILGGLAAHPDAVAFFRRMLKGGS